MVMIVDYKERKNEDGEHFFVLILEGGVELVKAKSTGRFYATAKRASVSSTFTEGTCKSLIGSTFPGSIKRETCEEYEYTIPESGETITMSHSWVYQDDVEETVDKVLIPAVAVI